VGRFVNGLLPAGLLTEGQLSVAKGEVFAGCSVFVRIEAIARLANCTRNIQKISNPSGRKLSPKSTPVFCKKTGDKCALARNMDADATNRDVAPLVVCQKPRA
jgi:hypothetical protein